MKRENRSLGDGKGENTSPGSEERENTSLGDGKRENTSSGSWAREKRIPWEWARENTSPGSQKGRTDPLGAGQEKNTSPGSQAKHSSPSCACFAEPGGCICPHPFLGRAGIPSEELGRHLQFRSFGMSCRSWRAGHFRASCPCCSGLLVSRASGVEGPGEMPGVFHPRSPGETRLCCSLRSPGMCWESGCCSFLPREPEVRLRAAVSTSVGSAGSGSDTGSHLERGWVVWGAICLGVVVLELVPQPSGWVL